VRTKFLRIVTPEQFEAIYQSLPEMIKLLVETDIETGLRWGELTEFRVRDLDRVTRVLTVSRTVVQVDPKFYPDGKRFLIKEYPKDKKPRPVKLGRQLVDKLVRHFEREDLGEDDLVFFMRLPSSRPASPSQYARKTSAMHTRHGFSLPAQTCRWSRNPPNPLCGLIALGGGAMAPVSAA
jgi:integrase